jgi:histone demethylase JARID1
VQRIDMLQKRGQGGQAVQTPWDQALETEATSAANAAAGVDPASSPRKAAEGSGTDSPTAMGSPMETDSAARQAAKRPSKSPQHEQGAAAAAAGKRKRDGTGAAGATTPNAVKRASATRRKRAKAAGGNSVDTYALTKCELCQGADHDGKLLLCDECDLGFHIFCLSPPLAAIPATDWYCPSCQANKINAFGFDMGRTFTLREYREHDAAFKRAWFTKEAARCATPTNSAATTITAADATAGPQADATTGASPIAAGPSASAPFVPPSAAAICASFWRIVESSREAVSVDYGSDLDTEILGSSLPRTGPYAQHPFNVNNLAIAPGGVFNWLDQSMLISGVTVPWLYVGMLFSTFCWSALLRKIVLRCDVWALSTIGSPGIVLCVMFDVFQAR